MMASTKAVRGDAGMPVGPNGDMMAKVDRLSALNQLAAFATTVNDKVKAALSERFERSQSEIETLISVRHCDTFTVGWLGEVLTLTHSAAVRITDRLERDGLVRRMPMNNRRFVGLVLTPAGVALADEILATRRDVLEHLCEGVDDGALEAAMPVFRSILGHNAGGMLASYQRCRLCDEAVCGASCPVQQTFGPRGET